MFQEGVTVFTEDPFQFDESNVEGRETGWHFRSHHHTGYLEIEVHTEHEEIWSQYKFYQV